MTLLSTLDRAEDEVRTRDLQLGRLSLYQLSYFRIASADTCAAAITLAHAVSDGGN